MANTLSLVWHKEEFKEPFPENKTQHTHTHTRSLCSSISESLGAGKQMGRIGTGSLPRVLLMNQADRIDINGPI